MGSFTVGDVVLTRVPYFDVPLDPEVIGFTAEQVAAVPWGEPVWADPDGRVVVGQALWVIDTGDHVIVVDPCGASDAFLRTGAEAFAHQAAVVSAMASAGFPVEDVDTVVMSHLDGIGMVAAVDGQGGWVPLFPRARIVITNAELAHVRRHPDTPGRAALLGLVAQGYVDGTEAPREIADGVTLELTAGHTPGHAVVRVGDEALFLGHLAVNPVQVCGGIGPDAHTDPTAAFIAVESALTWAAERGALVIGPLWPEPGAGRVAGPPWSISPGQPDSEDAESEPGGQ
jgi:glyoxylase-like metal-dependent hydrolase (beta-lactamase superfamily II)